MYSAEYYSVVQRIGRAAAYKKFMAIRQAFADYIESLSTPQSDVTMPSNILGNCNSASLDHSYGNVAMSQQRLSLTAGIYDNKLRYVGYINFLLLCCFM